jgi:Na+-transporting NADH:ubiquinone oxidoreductase subunit NqrB
MDWHFTPDEYGMSSTAYVVLYSLAALFVLLCAHFALSAYNVSWYLSLYGSISRRLQSIHLDSICDCAGGGLLILIHFVRAPITSPNTTTGKYVLLVLALVTQLAALLLHPFVHRFRMVQLFILSVLSVMDAAALLIISQSYDDNVYGSQVYCAYF